MTRESCLVLFFKSNQLSFKYFKYLQFTQKTESSSGCTQRLEKALKLYLPQKKAKTKKQLFIKLARETVYWNPSKTSVLE